MVKTKGDKAIRRERKTKDGMMKCIVYGSDRKIKKSEDCQSKNLNGEDNIPYSFFNTFSFFGVINKDS